MAKYYDHLGNEYKTKKDMCETYGMNLKLLHKRLSKGLSLEEALTRPKICGPVKQCTDHLGNVFATEKAMCGHYHINKGTYRNRISRGWTNEQALTTPLKIENHSKDCFYDHLGNKYKTQKEMCAHYNVKASTFRSRLKNGLSLKKALLSTPHYVTDHLGNKYKNIEEMCKAYGISASAYHHRIRRGFSLEDALTKPSHHQETVIKAKKQANDCVVEPSKSFYYDHLGNKYCTIKGMAEAYGIDASTFCERIKRNWSLKDALTLPLGYKRENPIKDHLGNTYPSKKEMCKAYNINPQLYNKRIRSGLSVEEALTTPTNRNKCVDHLGKRYSSQKEMAEAYNITYDVLYRRLKAGMTLEDALTKTKKVKGHFDHKGNYYSSIEEMANAYNISENALRVRLEKGMTLEEALESKKKGKVQRKCKDHLGNEYNSVREMCAHYGINDITFTNRINKNGWSLEKALTTPIKEKRPIVDHLGNEYSTIKEMCAHYNIGKTTYTERLKKGWTLEKVLTTPTLDTIPVPSKDHLGNVYESRTEMCRAYGIKEKILRKRLKRGWTLEKALTTPSTRIHIKDVYCSYQHTFNGKHYYKCTSKNWDKAKILTLEEINKL